MNQSSSGVRFSMNESEVRADRVATYLLPSMWDPSPGEQERPTSPVQNCVPMKSRQSLSTPLDFKVGGISDGQIPVGQQGPESPVHNWFSSSRSKFESVDFKDGGISDKDTPVGQQGPEFPVHNWFSSSRSKFESVDFKDGGISDKDTPVGQQGPEFPVHNWFSSSRSKFESVDFKDGGISDKDTPVGQQGPEFPVHNWFSSSRSKFESVDFKDGGISDKETLPGHRKRSEVLSRRPPKKHQTDLDSEFMLLEESMMTFMKDELKRLKKVLSTRCSEPSLKLRDDDDEVPEAEEGEEGSGSRDAFLTIALGLLRKSKQDQMADFLQSKSLAAVCQRKLKSSLRRKVQYLFEGIATAGKPTPLNQIYTELLVTQGESREVKSKHDVGQIEDASLCSEKTIRSEDMFKPSPDRGAVRTVVTKGVAGIGKTVLTQKFILDWAEAKAYHNIHFIFPFTFRELNVLRKRKYSLVELLHLFFTETKEAGICRLEEFNVVFIFDSLDECRLCLDFNNSDILTDVTESTSLEVLLTNLIRGTLLPSAHLWITTRPATANQIPPECIGMVTEVRGFSDPEKEEYFRKSFSDLDQANRIISHIEKSRSLRMMCHIPVFCWISAWVLANELKIKGMEELPKTVTEIYIHFLVVQTKRWNIKYNSSEVTVPVWTEEAKKTIQCLGKLAFEQLEKGDLLFYEADLRKCGLDIKVASVYSGLLTNILKDNHGLNQENVFCFVHLSIQEFLAALFVFLTYLNTGVNLLRKSMTPPLQNAPFQHKFNFNQLFQRAVDNTLQSPNGHLDLFVRFLLGLSLETNQTLLKGLLMKVGGTPQTRKMLIQHVKKKICENHSPESRINLLHCLNELNDHSLVEEIQQSLSLGTLSVNKLSSSQWSALVYILLSSQKDLDEFDLRKFAASEVGFKQLLPVVKASKTSLMSDCGLSARSCEAFVSVLTSKNCNLRVVDLSDNDLHDDGAMLLSSGLRSPHCRLEILRLSGCQITENGCIFLASSLDSNPSHLRELDLSFNHPGESGVKLLSAGLENPCWKLETLKMDYCGKCRLNPSPLKYFCRLSLDPNTEARTLSLTDENTKGMVVTTKQPYPDHPERLDGWKQLLCSDGLTGRWFWEVQWKGRVRIGVTYRGIMKRGDGDDCCMEWNYQSWSLFCSHEGYTPCHNDTPTVVTTPLPSDSNRVGVYLDWAAGTVTFYCLPSRVSSIKLIHLHTFYATFTEPLYPAFWFGRLSELGTDSQTLSSSIYLPLMDE